MPFQWNWNNKIVIEKIIPILELNIGTSLFNSNFLCYSFNVMIMACRCYIEEENYMAAKKKVTKKKVAKKVPPKKKAVTRKKVATKKKVVTRKKAAPKKKAAAI